MAMAENTYKTDGTLDAFPNPHPGRDYTIEFVAPEFTSVCRAVYLADNLTGLPATASSCRTLSEKPRTANFAAA